VSQKKAGDHPYIYFYASFLRDIYIDWFNFVYNPHLDL
jgi:hypothetical protein